MDKKVWIRIVKKQLLICGNGGLNPFNGSIRYTNGISRKTSYTIEEFLENGIAIISGVGTKWC